MADFEHHSPAVSNGLESIPREKQMGPTPNAQQWIADLRSRVDARLTQFLKDKEAETAHLAPDSIELVDGIRELTMRGGKRLRPALLAAAYHAVCADGDETKTLDLCAAVEILQTFLLIHDDIMDGDEQRRGGPAVHTLFRQKHSDAALGDALGILAGDLASAYSWELTLQSPFPKGREREAYGVFLQINTEVFLGQHLDLTASKDVTRMHDLKTGSYTVRGPLLLGAVLGNASQNQMKVLHSFASPLGLAFQVRDDLLGTFGQVDVTGKPAGNDLRVGKRTSLIEEAEKSIPLSERRALTDVFGLRTASDEAVAAATSLLIERGVRARMEEKLKTLLSEANRALESSLLSKKGATLLRALSDLLALRDH